MSVASTNRRPGRVHPARMGAKTSSYWSDLTREHGFEALKVEGEIPPALSGTLYRTGPALTQRFGRPYGHVFEGDGAICAVRLSDGSAHGAHRLLRGEGFVKEEMAGRPLYQTATSWPRQVANSLLGRSKNTGNTNVLEWHGALFALMENARPLAFDRELETIGETSLGGLIRGAFSAHPHAMVSRRTTYNFGLRYGRNTTLGLYALPWEGQARCLGEIPLDHPVMLHDFMATQDHLVFLVSPLRLVVHRAILSVGDFTDLFRWTPDDGTEVIVVPIDAPERVRRFRVDPFFQIHFAGGVEEDDATVVDIMAYADSSALTKNVADIDEPPECGVVTRIRIPHDAERIEKQRICDSLIEFGQLDPRAAGSIHPWLVLSGDSPSSTSTSRAGRRSSTDSPTGSSPRRCSSRPGLPMRKRATATCSPSSTAPAATRVISPSSTPSSSATVPSAGRTSITTSPPGSTEPGCLDSASRPSPDVDVFAPGHCVDERRGVAVYWSGKAARMVSARIWKPSFESAWVKT